MREWSVFSLGVVALLATACGGRRATEIRTTEYPVGSRWNATLATPAGLAGAAQIRGNAWMAEGHDSAETRVHVEVENATPGGQHPWHVHRGHCGTDQGILGPAERYGILEVGGDGKASREVTLPVALPRSGSYMVNVHASPQNLGTIVACGNLSPPTR